jgi:hypothetical protein
VTHCELADRLGASQQITPISAVTLSLSRRGLLMIFAGSKLADQKQDQQDNNHKAKAAAPVVASTVKRATANSTKAAQQRDH